MQGREVRRGVDTLRAVGVRAGDQGGQRFVDGVQVAVPVRAEFCAGVLEGQGAALEGQDRDGPRVLVRDALPVTQFEDGAAGAQAAAGGGDDLAGGQSGLHGHDPQVAQFPAGQDLPDADGAAQRVAQHGVLPGGVQAQHAGVVQHDLLLHLAGLGAGARDEALAEREGQGGHGQSQRQDRAEQARGGNPGRQRAFQFAVGRQPREAQQRGEHQRDGQGLRGGLRDVQGQHAGDQDGVGALGEQRRDDLFEAADDQQADHGGQRPEQERQDLVQDVAFEGGQAPHRSLQASAAASSMNVRFGSHAASAGFSAPAVARPGTVLHRT